MSEPSASLSASVSIPSKLSIAREVLFDTFWFGFWFFCLVRWSWFSVFVSVYTGAVVVFGLSSLSGDRDPSLRWIFVVALLVCCVDLAACFSGNDDAKTIGALLLALTASPPVRTIEEWTRRIDDERRSLPRSASVSPPLDE